ncbi:hypothetical protein ZWY2020_042650 [Hordeum vulgare]|nr:hypothetical protein ZWY2020_042650 [Hordeum vulgare]
MEAFQRWFEDSTSVVLPYVLAIAAVVGASRNGRLPLLFRSSSSRYGPMRSPHRVGQGIPAGSGAGRGWWRPMWPDPVEGTAMGAGKGGTMDAGSVKTKTHRGMAEGSSLDRQGGRGGGQGTGGILCSTLGAVTTKAGLWLGRVREGR